MWEDRIQRANLFQASVSRQGTNQMGRSLTLRMPLFPGSLLSPVIGFNSRKFCLCSNFISCLYSAGWGSGEKSELVSLWQLLVLARFSLLSLSHMMPFPICLAFFPQLFNSVLLFPNPLRFLYILCELWTLNNDTYKLNRGRFRDVVISWLTRFVTLFLMRVVQNQPTALLRCQNVQHSPCW